VKLLIQPDNGIKPLLEAIRQAKKSIRILIFRFDRAEIEKALVAAAARGVSVHALIAYTNQGEEKNLRRLEMRLLAQGITVARTADDLVRYHGKMMIIDEKTLYVLGFNFTHLDIDLSRSFGVAITRSGLVKEAIRLFECDAKRQPYTGGKEDLVVSPVNARKRLTEFISGARKKLLLYEMKISDNDFLKLLNKKISEGVEVRILSRASAKNGGGMPVRRLTSRLHLRAILRDGNSAFIGSQSLRKLELEARREVGVIFRDKAVVKQMESVFEKDWKKSEPAVEKDNVTAFNIPASKVAKQVAKHIAIKPVVEQVLDKVIDSKDDASFEPEEVAQTVKEAFREELHGAVVDALQDLVAKTARQPEEVKASDRGKE
jgi:cardiolipin synthase A/B